MTTRLLFATDLHGHRQAYEELFERARSERPLALVLGGDLLPLPLGQGKDLLAIQRDFVTDFLEPALRSLRAGGGPPVFGVLGNDDWEASRAAFVSLGAEGIFHDIHMRRVPLGERWIAGYSCVPVTPFQMSDWDRFDSAVWSPQREPKRVLLTDTGVLREGTLRDLRQRATIEEDLRDLGRAGDPSNTIYVCHTPPHGTNLDQMHGDTFIGSQALRAFIEKEQPPLTLHGHVHESPRMSGAIEDRLGKTLCVNPGDSRSKLRAVVVELEPEPRIIP